QYSWSPTGTTNASVNGLQAGNYFVTVTDDNGCTSTASTTISQPGQLIISASSTVSPSCYGGTDGTATVTAFGGTPGYNFNWITTGTNGPTATNLMAGTYFANVTDAAGCVMTTSVNISQPLELTTAISNVTPVSCFN